MKAVADASFLLPLVTRDAHTKAAARWWAGHAEVVAVSSLALFESENALRSLRLRGLIGETDERNARRRLEGFTLQGLLEVHHLRPRLLVAEARRLIDHFSPEIPHGTLDVLHVAAARLLRAGTLASFDDNQRALAKSAGLEVAP
ncbi:MAG: type II toxin-antitoxin system VapC family toxin [Verrucomicrobiales bacterium]